MESQPPAPYQQQPPAYIGNRPTNTLAIVSLGAGVSAFVITHFIGALVAIITGYMARGQIRQTGEGGAGLALAGLVLGYVYFAILALVILVVIALVLGFGALFVTTTPTQ